MSCSCSFNLAGRTPFHGTPIPWTRAVSSATISVAFCFGAYPEWHSIKMEVCFGSSLLHGRTTVEKMPSAFLRDRNLWPSEAMSFLPLEGRPKPPATMMQRWYDSFYDIWRINSTNIPKNKYQQISKFCNSTWKLCSKTCYKISGLSKKLKFAWMTLKSLETWTHFSCAGPLGADLDTKDTTRSHRILQAAEP